MLKPSMRLAVLMLSMSLTACSTMPSFMSSTGGPGATMTKQPTKEQGTFVTNTGNAVPVAAVKESNQALGGTASNSMDVIDKSKLSRALDSPLGKSTHWSNANTGIDYTVVTTQKVTVNGNSLCRKYNIEAAKDDKTRQMSGTACVSTDGNWHPVD